MSSLKQSFTKKDDDGWTYTGLQIDVSPESFADFASFKMLWDARREVNLLPAWRSFDFSDFKGWYGWLIVEDVLSRSPYDARFRLWGTNVANLFDVDLTGKCISQLEESICPPTSTGVMDLMLDGHHICTASGPMRWQHQTFKSYKMFICPLADDGTTVDKFLTAISVVKKN